jgi:hypothetical protein
MMMMVVVVVARGHTGIQEPWTGSAQHTQQVFLWHSQLQGRTFLNE